MKIVGKANFVINRIYAALMIIVEITELVIPMMEPVSVINVIPELSVTF